MIVVEPEKATTKDNIIYAPTTNGESLVPGIASSLSRTSSSTCSWTLSLDEGAYEVHADIPAGTLMLQRDNEDAITFPLGEDGERSLFTPSGLPATNRTRGIVIGKDKKLFINR